MAVIAEAVAAVAVVVVLEIFASAIETVLYSRPSIAVECSPLTPYWGLKKQGNSLHCN